MITKDERKSLFSLAEWTTLGPITVREYNRLVRLRPFIQRLETLVTLGLATVHRSSIGELDEKATYTITEKGRTALVEKV